MADFVVVANRLPVDMETLPDGTTEWRASPGGLVTALAPMLRGRGGAWVGWPGRRGRRARAVRGGRAHAAPGPAVRAGGRGLLRGLLQRHAVAALPRRRGATGVPPALVAGLRQGQRTVRRRRRRGGRRRRHGLGAGLPAPAAPGRAARATARSAHRVLPAHPLPADRALPAAPLAQTDHRGPAGRRPRRVPHRWVAPATSAPSRPASPTRPSSGASCATAAGRVRVGAFPISIDAHTLDELARPRRSRIAPRRSAPSSAIPST